MEQSGSQKSKSPSQLIDARVNAHPMGAGRLPIQIGKYTPTDAHRVGVVAFGPAQLEARISAMSCAKIISSLPTTDGSAGEDR